MTDYQKYINALRKCAKEHENDTTYTGNIVVSALCKDTANLLETLEQEPKTGHWISDAIQGEIDGQIVKAFTCSKCGAISVFRMTDGKIVNGDLCPNCGAKMKNG